MGMYGGGSPPPPPPTYEREKADWSGQQSAKYQTEADAYNTSVGAFNQQLANQQSGLSGLSSQIGGLSIADLGAEAPNYRGQLGEARAGIGAANVSTARPSFSSAGMSPWGSVSVNVPSLLDPNENLRSSLLNQVGGLSSTLEGLRRERGAEEGRINQFRSGALGNIAALRGGIGRTSIGNEFGINQLGSTLDQLRGNVSGFASPIASQLYGDPGGEGVFPTIQSRLGSAQSELTDLGARRTSELGRIEDFRTAQEGGYDALRGAFQPLTIANEGALRQMGTDIGTQRLGIQRFRSDIPTNFSPTLGNLQSLSGDVNRRLAERETELGRIGQAESQARGVGRDVAGQAADTGIYSSARLKSLEDRIAEGREGFGRFSSELPFDFGGAESRLTGAEGTLAGLRTERAGSLDDLISRANVAGAGLGEIPLQDEGAIRGRLSDLIGIGGELAPFSGGRVGDVNAAISQSQAGIDTRLEELSTKRTEIETGARALLENVGITTFTDLAAVEAQLDELGLVEEKQQLFNATQALDEIASIQDRLNSEKQRLENDLEASTGAAGRERQSILSALGAGGVPQFQDFQNTQPLTAAEYLALLARREEEDQYGGIGGGYNTGFSSNLGVIQA